MNRIVVYNSATGFTKKYAEWISEGLNCEIKNLKQIKLSQLKNYDQVIFGSPIMASMVSSYNKIRNLGLKDVVVFSCGITVPSEEETKKMAEVNQIPQKRFFYFEGGYNPSKLGFAKRFLLNMIKKSLENKQNKTKSDLRMIETFNGADRTDKEAIKPLIEFCNR